MMREWKGGLGRWVQAGQWEKGRAFSCGGKNGPPSTAPPPLPPAPSTLHPLSQPLIPCLHSSSTQLRKNTHPAPFILLITLYAH